jgi:hypothetical protein
MIRSQKHVRSELIMRKTEVLVDSARGSTVQYRPSQAHPDGTPTTDGASESPLQTIVVIYYSHYAQCQFTTGP